MRIYIIVVSLLLTAIFLYEIKLGVNIETTKYSLISASRTVIKSESNNSGFYKEDLWKIASDYLKNYLNFF